MWSSAEAALPKQLVEDQRRLCTGISFAGGRGEMSAEVAGGYGSWYGHGRGGPKSVDDRGRWTLVV
jgi:hypothetical protein